MKCARKREGVGQDLQRVTEVDNEDRLAGIELALEFLGLEARRRQFFENHAAPEDAAHKEDDDAQEEQTAGEAAGPIQQAGVALE